jgi:hypothetical protein
MSPHYLDEGHQAKENKCAGDGEGEFPHRHEVETRFVHQFEKIDSFDFFVAEKNVVNEAAAKEYGKEIKDNA